MTANRVELYPSALPPAPTAPVHPELAGIDRIGELEARLQSLRIDEMGL